MPEHSPAWAARAPWQPGDQLGRYSLVGKIATGGMAEIWLARQAGLKGFEKLLVIKKMSDAVCEDADFVEMFLDEARIAAQLAHPNIVQIFDLGEHQGGHYIAMEYLHGETLHAVLREGIKQSRPLPIPYAVKLVATAAEALDYAHGLVGPDQKPLRIVHRDVSPSNLIVTYDGILKVVDFGIAKAATRASHTGRALKGTMGYLSPEQIRSEPLDGRADVFALGIVLFEATTRTRLFPLEDPFLMTAAIAGSEPMPRAKERNPQVPDSLDLLIAKALTRDRAQRYQSAAAFHSALSEWLYGDSNPPAAADISRYMHTLFAQRIEQRLTVLDAARTGEPFSSGKVPVVSGRGLPAMPGQTAVLAPPDADASAQPTVLATSLPGPVPRRRRWKLAATLAALGGAAAVWAWTAPLFGSAPESRSTPSAEPPPTVLVVETDPAGAAVSLDSVPRGTTPLTLEGLPVGDHELVATLPDRPAVTRSVRFDSPGERSKVFLSLPPLSFPDAGSFSEEERSSPSRPSRAVRQGKLTLDSEPWTRVFLGTKQLGDTPLIDFPLPAGRHRLRLVNEEERIQRSYEVEIQPNRTTVKRLRF